MIQLSAFADEVSPSLPEALRVLREEHIAAIDLRSHAGTNVLDLTDQQLGEIKKLLHGEGFTVTTIATPLGKVAVHRARERDRFARALSIAGTLSARFVRVFSYYGPSQPWSAPDRLRWRGEILRRLTSMAEQARRAGVTLLVENDQDTFADTPPDMAALLADIPTGARTAFDPGNFALCGAAAYPDAFHVLEPWITSVHVKDVDADGLPVSAGAGVCNWPDIIRALADRDMHLALEPHLHHAGRAGGFTGPERFAHAAAALRSLINQSWIREEVKS